MLKDKFAALWAKVVENKELVIRVGVGLAGAVVGAAVTAVVIRAQQDSFPYSIDEMVNDEEVEA